MLNWHVALIERGKGLVAERMVQAKGFEVFNPKIIVKKKWSYGRIGWAVKPYVPGYMFIRFDPDVYGWELINQLPCSGIKTLMYAASEVPARVRDEALLPLMALCKPGGFIVEQVKADKILYNVGVAVKVIEGPFAGFTGTVQEVVHQRLKVLVHVFGRPTRLDGDAGMFEPLKG